MTDVATPPGETLTLTATVPVDLTGGSGTFPVYDAPGGNAVASGTATVTDAPNGAVTFTLDGSQSAQWANQYHVFYYETWVRAASGQQTRVDAGRLTVA